MPRRYVAPCKQESGLKGHYLVEVGSTTLLTFTPKGIYCPYADVYIDPWRGVDRAIVTHAHSDHARGGSRQYLATPVTKALMHARMGIDLNIEAVGYGEPITINGVRFSLHPAGHIPGSAQVHVEHKGEVWVATGDYKRQEDGISTPFEPVRCHTLITECTFGLPIYRWKEPREVFAELNAWWRGNAANGICSVISAYSLGKAQRVMTGVDRSIGPILVHGAVANMNTVLQECGLELPRWEHITKDTPKERFRNALVITPGSALDTTWANRMKPFSSAMASGWMQLRGWRRRANIEKGFVLSDHADWDGLLHTVRESGAERVIATHGYTDLFSQYLRSVGSDAAAETTEFVGEAGADLQEGTRSVDPPGRPATPAE
ncbi:MAG: ligase-associated DNA damage response exonuclease [Flavobacteriales bacterium]|nr:ligase-associated DNA damage response exonuclease [Flavobacteriales bacterium]